jgi:hypothetical protein
LPHPVSDPAGHSFGSTPSIERFDPGKWRESRAFLWGVDLFNYGYYWEAHEAWEGIWRGYDRGDTPALFLQGLIKLAAAGVKKREGIARGVAHLASEATAHFREVRGRADGGARFCGLSVSMLESAASRVEQAAAVIESDANPGPLIVFDFVLCPGDTEK